MLGFCLLQDVLLRKAQVELLAWAECSGYEQPGRCRRALPLACPDTKQRRVFGAASRDGGRGVSCYLHSIQAGCSGVLEALGDKALCQHRVLFAALLSISLTGLQTLSQKLILLGWMSSFTSPSVIAG